LKQTNQCSNRCFVAKGPDGLPHKVTHNIHIEFRQYSTFIDAPVVAIIPTEAYIAACLHASRPHGHRRITDAWSGPNWALTIHHIGFKRLWECVSQGAPKWAKNRMTQQQSTKSTRHKASSTDQGSAAGPPSCRGHNDAYRCQQSVEEQVKYLHGSREGLLQLSGVAAR
jgi:hypothetical protein